MRQSTKKGAGRRTRKAEETGMPKKRRPRAARAERVVVEPQGVVKEGYIQLIVNNEPFVLEGSHPTFPQLAAAVRNKEWRKVPRLVTLAAALEDASAGDVTVRRGRIFYKGTEMDSSMTRDIIKLMQGGRDVQPQLRFMAKLMRNPSAEARERYWDWRKNNDLPIADDGDVVAYKSVDAELMDEYTHTISNHPGAVISGPRKWFNNNYRTQCASGFHVCSRRYGVYGERVMLVKFSPADILSAPEGGKMRVRRYEVLWELTHIPRDDREARKMFQEHGVPEIEGKVVMEVARERREMVAALLADPQVKRLIRRKKIGRSTIQRGTHAYLTRLLRRFGLDETTSTADSGEPELRQARKQAGFSVKEVADALGVSLRTVYRMELRDPADGEETARYMAALEYLKGARVKGELRMVREEAGLTAAQVAEAMNVGTAQVTRLEMEQTPAESQRDQFLEAVARLKGVCEGAGSALTYTKRVAAVALAD